MKDVIFVKYNLFIFLYRKHFAQFQLTAHSFLFFFSFLKRFASSGWVGNGSNLLVDQVKTKLEH